MATASIRNMTPIIAVRIVFFASPWELEFPPEVMYFTPPQMMNRAPMMMPKTKTHWVTEQTAEYKSLIVDMLEVGTFDGWGGAYASTVPACRMAASDRSLRSLAMMAIYGVRVALLDGGGWQGTG